MQLLDYFMKGREAPETPSVFAPTKETERRSIPFENGDSHGRGSMTLHLYKIEIRSSDRRSFNSEYGIIDGVWRSIHFGFSSQADQQDGNKTSIPCSSRDSIPLNLGLGLMTLELAEAHRAVVIARLRSKFIYGEDIQTRLVCVEFSLSYETHEKGVTEAKKHSVFELDELKLTRRAP